MQLQLGRVRESLEEPSQISQPCSQRSLNDEAEEQAQGVKRADAISTGCFMVSVLT